MEISGPSEEDVRVSKYAAAISEDNSSVIDGSYIACAYVLHSTVNDWLYVVFLTWF